MSLEKRDWYESTRHEWGASRQSKRKNRRGKRTGDIKKDFVARAKRSIFHRYSWGAKNRGYVFELDECLFERLLEEPCHYCGEEFSNLLKSSSMDAWTAKKFPGMEFPYNGVDRANNDLGYLEHNVVACCGDCNKLKLTTNKEDFLAKIGKIAKHNE